jgi:hypothetical protein
LTPHGDPLAVLFLPLLIVTFGYIGTCVIWPFRACRRCQGTGRLRSPLLLGAFRLCPRCNATGRRLRVGRRVWNAYRSLHHDIRRGIRDDRRRDR